MISFWFYSSQWVSVRVGNFFDGGIWPKVEVLNWNNCILYYNEWKFLEKCQNLTFKKSVQNIPNLWFLFICTQYVLVMDHIFWHLNLLTSSIINNKSCFEDPPSKEFHNRTDTTKHIDQSDPRTTLTRLIWSSLNSYLATPPIPKIICVKNWRAFLVCEFTFK